MGSPMLAPAAVHAALAWDLQVLLTISRAGVKGLMRAECVAGECAETSFTESRQELPDGIGFTAIYSKRDGIVDWRGCIDPQAEAVEVWGSHLGMILDPRAFDAVATALRGFAPAVPGQMPALPAARVACAG